MAIPKPITRVEQYLAHISGMRVNVPEVPLTREEMYLSAWARKSGIEDTEMQGDPPLTLKDCIGEPFNGLVLYGKSTQVTTTGAQLFTSAVIKKENSGVKLTKKDSVWHLEGTNTADGVRNIRLMEPTEHFKLPAGTYTLSFSKDGVFPIGINIAIAKVANPDISSEQIWTGIGNAGLNTPKKFVLDGTEEALSIYVNFPAGEPISCDLYVMLNAGDSALPWEPYTGGKPSPSPDYPQEIQSAKSEVVVHGKNLLGGRFYYARYSSGIMYINKTQKDEEVKFPYQPESETAGICKALKCRKGKTYIISVTNPNKNASLGMAEYENIEKAININNALGFVNIGNNALKKSYTAKSDGILVCGIAGTWTNGKTSLHECTESELLQAEEASEVTSYEPYREPQTLTITSPTSLPGIPVDSDGNYTDQTGQQWICDEVDFERGVYVQRIYTVDIAELEYSAGTILQTVKRIFYKISVPSTGTTNKGYCTRLTYSANYSADNPHFYINEERIVVFIPLDTTIKPKEYLVQYVLATPIETPLSETDIAAYRALTTYKGTTILESECYLKVKYSKLRK